MPRPKRKPKPNKTAHKEVHKTVLGSDDENLKSSEYYHDEVDEFHLQKDKILLDGETFSHDFSSSEEEEVMAIDDDEDSDDDYEDEYSTRLIKDEMASDIEENEEEGLPSVKAWGKKKSLYYNTDFVDQDFGRGYREADAEAAEAEEKEALAMQKRLAEEIDEADFGLELFEKKEVDKTDTKAVEMDEKVVKDLSKMSKKEKLELLKKESPELLELINDFKNKLTELGDKLEPLRILVKDGRIPPGAGADYIETKYQLILHYCTNISFYLVLKSRGTQVRSHPVIKRLLTYRKLLQQLETVDNNLSEEINIVLEKLKNGEEIHPLPVESEVQTEQTIKTRIKDTSPVKSFSKEIEKEEKTKNRKKKIRFETEEEKEILSMYIQAKGTQKTSDDESEELSEDISENDDGMELEEAEENDYDESNANLEEEKRGITYQIAKNKGLTAHRKKEYRNPRVRHRMKFRKAKIRRRGQVREVRKELQRYGGELSGIRIGVKKGIKLK